MFDSIGRDDADLVTGSFVSGTQSAGKDILCFSHLRWEFVHQRPQHLLGRAAAQGRVFYWEEPIIADVAAPVLEVRCAARNLTVIRPLIPSGNDDEVTIQRKLLNQFIVEARIGAPVLWYYTPRALAFSNHLVGTPIVYDCMDELAAFRFADPRLPEIERELLRRATVVFTGGFSLMEAKAAQHDNVHCFPSGVDVAHFLPARRGLADPADQADIPYPRLGFYGVIDERFDLELLRQIALTRPDWQLVMVGPIAKISPDELPRLPNIHYLGPKSYRELPQYSANWDVALMPFAINAATQFISPTKTPEYLAAGLPVVSTPIKDVVRTYGSLPGVEIADGANEFVIAIELALDRVRPENWLAAVDHRLQDMSWDQTWQRMNSLLEAASTGATPHRPKLVAEAAMPNKSAARSR